MAGELRMMHIDLAAGFPSTTRSMYKLVEMGGDRRRLPAPIQTPHRRVLLLTPTIEVALGGGEVLVPEQPPNCVQIGPRALEVGAKGAP